MKVVIRVDASQHIGSGHVMRCLVLAEALKDDGQEVMFATREQMSDLNAFIVQKGFGVIALQQPSEWKTPRDTADYAVWLQMTEEEDADDFIEKAGHADLVIVDHYGISKYWHDKIKAKLGCTLFVIDDLVRANSADLLLDQTLNRAANEYVLSAENSMALTGTDYALLKPEFAKVRHQLKTELRPNHKILISMGGIDQPNASLAVLESLSKHIPKIPTTVLLSQRAPNYESVRSFAVSHSSWVEHIDFVENMANFMAQYTVAIGAPGSTSWERACLGIPAIIVPIAENQKDIATALKKAKAAEVIQLDEIDETMAIMLERVMENWSLYREANFALCDGKGCDRVIAHIKKVMNVC